MKNVIVIISYKPDSRLTELTKELMAEGADNIIVVDDGSGGAYSDIYAPLQSSFCTVIHHEKNQGKGMAIKTGLTEVLKWFPDAAGAVIADGDGQHSAKDIMKISLASESFPQGIILGKRNLKRGSVPHRYISRNRLSSFAFRLDTGKSCPDTQTGLRAIPASYIPFAISVDGSRFEYESNFLAAASAKGIPFKQIEIETLFLDGNTTYYNPVLDSARVLKSPLRFFASSLGCSTMDIILFTVFCAVFNTRETHHIFKATFLARIISGTFNFVINKKWSFTSSGSFKKQFAKYIVFFIFQMLLSSTFVSTLSFIHIPLAAIKIVVDTMLFIVSYFVQRRWVFKV